MNTTLHSFMDIFDTAFVDGDTDVKLQKIIIPIIQRDYAQGRRDPDIDRVRKRFLDSLYNAVIGSPITLDFVYGDIDEEEIRKIIWNIIKNDVNTTVPRYKHIMNMILTDKELIKTTTKNVTPRASIDIYFSNCTHFGTLSSSVI